MGSLLLLIALLWLADHLWPLPLPKDDLARVVLAEDGTPLWRFADANGVWRYPVTTDQVSPYYLDALLTYEDRWFYQHPGVNPLALVRATWQNLSGARVVSGGSTLSMQVARLLDPHSRTLPGKLRQLWRTAQLEWHLSKDQILGLYLNRAPFGGTLQGVAAASWAYLGKSPLQLTRADAALLAVLPQAPSRLRPDRHPKRAQAARDKVLTRLAEFEVWPQSAVDEALEEPLLLAPRQEPSLAPLLARRLNRADSPPLIRTTIDATLQRRLEDLLLGWRARLPEHTSAAILVVEEETMAVRAFLALARHRRVTDTDGKRCWTGRLGDVVDVHAAEAGRLVALLVVGDQDVAGEVLGADAHRLHTFTGSAALLRRDEPDLVRCRRVPDVDHMDAVLGAALATPCGEVRIAVEHADVGDLARLDVLQFEFAHDFDVRLARREVSVVATVLRVVMTVRRAGVVDGAVVSALAIVSECEASHRKRCGNAHRRHNRCTFTRSTHVVAPFQPEEAGSTTRVGQASSCQPTAPMNCLFQAIADWS